MNREKRNTTTQSPAEKFAQPTVMNAMTAAFGGGDIRDLMPRYDDIPKDFLMSGIGRKWTRFQRDWFYAGIDPTGLKAKDGIDKQVALRHLGAVNGSFEPKHEHKEAGVAYLASLWFDPSSTWTQAAKK